MYYIISLLTKLIGHLYIGHEADRDVRTCLLKNNEMKSQMIFCTAMSYVIFAFMFIYIWHNPLRVHADCALLIECCQKIVDGGIPFVDTMDTNPPMAMYVNVVPILLSKILGIHVLTAFLFWVWFLIVSLTVAIRYACYLYLSEADYYEINILILAYSFFHLYILTNTLDFGQREHLFTIAYFPFFILRWMVWEQRKVSIYLLVIFGAIMGVYTSLKYYFIPIVLVPEIYWAVRKRRIKELFSVDIIILECVILLYVVHFFVLPTRMEFYHWFSMVWKGHSAYNTTEHRLWGNYMSIMYPLAIYAVYNIAYLSTKKSCMDKLLPPFSAAAICCCVSYLWQHKGWSYHFIPVYFGGTILLVGGVINIIIKRSSAYRYKGIPSLYIVFFLSLILFQIHQIPNIMYGDLFQPWYSYLIFICIVFMGIICKIENSMQSLLLWAIYILITGLFWLIFSSYPNVQMLMKYSMPFVTLMVLLSLVKFKGFVNVSWWRNSSVLNKYMIYSINMMLLLPFVLWSANQINNEKAKTVRYHPIDRVIMRYSKEGDSILVINQSVGIYWRLLQLNRTNASRYAYSFPIVYAYRNVNSNVRLPYEKGRYSDDERKYLKDLHEDIDKTMPKIIFIKNDSPGGFGLPIQFDFMKYLTNAGFVKNVMCDYTSIGSVEQYHVFVLKNNNKEYLDKLKYDQTYSTSLENMDKLFKEGTPWNDPDAFIFDRDIWIDLGKTYYVPIFSISADSNDDYSVDFYNSTDKVGTACLNNVEGLGLSERPVIVPLTPVEKGYNRLRISPRTGDGKYSIGHIKITDESPWKVKSESRRFVSKSQIATFKSSEASLDDTGTILFDLNGLFIELEKMYYCHTWVIGLNSGTNYLFAVYRNDEKIYEKTVLMQITQQAGLASHFVFIPDGISSSGYNRIAITPISKEGTYCVGYMNEVKENTFRTPKIRN